MGSQVSVQQMETQQESLNETLNSVLNNINNKTSQQASNVQKIKFKIKGDFTIGGNAKFDITQTSTVKMDALINSVGETASEVASEVTNNFEVENIVDNIMETSGIVLGQSQVSVQKDKIVQNFETTIQNEVKSAIESTISLEVGQENTIMFDIGGDFNILDNAEFKLNQKSVIETIAKTATNSVVSSILTSISINEAKASTTMSNSMKMEGISIWGLGLLLLVPFIIMFAGGFAIIKLFYSIFPVLMIIVGIIIIVQYYNCYYYYCINDPKSDKYIKDDYKDEVVPNDVYINPAFRESPGQKLEDSDVSIPSGTGSPVIAYLKAEKQSEYVNLEKSLDDKDAKKEKIEKNMSKIASNMSNYMCVNKTGVQNDRNKSDEKILYFLPCRLYILIIGIVLIIIGLLSLIYIIFMKGSTNTIGINEEITPYPSYNGPIPQEQ